MRLSRRTTLLLLVLPAVVYAIYLALPVFASMRMSLNSFTRSEGIVPDLTLGTYVSVLTDSFYRSAWFSTMRLAATAAALTVLLGTTVAYTLWRVGGRARAYLTVVTLAPLMVSSVVRAYGWIAAAGPSGLLPKLTEAIGLGEVSFLFNRTAVIVGFVHVLLPFVVILILARLDAVNPRLLRAAASLGAGPLQTFRRVMLPLLTPAMIAAFFVTFALATGSYAIPAVLGGGRVRTITRQIVQEQLIIFDWPRAATLAVLLSGLTLVAMFASQVVLRRRRT